MVIPLHFLGFGAVAAVDERVAAFLGTGDLLLYGLWAANVVVWYGGVAFVATVLYAILATVGTLPA